MNFSRVPLYFGSLEYMSKKIFKNNQWLALGLIIFGGLVGFFPFNAQANVSASMINALPQKTSQVFPLQKSMISATQAQKITRQPLPPQKPKYHVVSTLAVGVTAYNSEVGQTDQSPYYTADGTWVYWGVAAGPYNLPFGTKFRVRGMFGDKIFEIHDRSATPYGHVDLWMDSRAKAIQFGRRNLIVEILA